MRIQFRKVRTKYYEDRFEYETSNGMVYQIRMRADKDPQYTIYPLTSVSSPDALRRLIRALRKLVLTSLNQ